MIEKLCRFLMHSYPFPYGSGRIIHHTFLRDLKFSDKTTTIKTKEGFYLRIAPNELIGRHLYLTGQFDHAIIDVISYFSFDGAMILYIGANIGYYSCVLLNKFPHSKVVAVEPLPAAFRLLTENIQNIDKKRGLALNVAVCDFVGEAKIIINKNNFGACRLMDRPNNYQECSNIDSVTVPVIDGKELMRLCGLQRIDIIKIDVEGAEEKVMSTLLPFIIRDRPKACIFECQKKELLLPDSYIRKTFESIGYDIFGIKKSLLKWRLIKINHLSEKGSMCNDYVAIPRK